MVYKRLPSRRQLSQLFSYDPDTGLLTRRSGKVVKPQPSQKYTSVPMGHNTRFQAHRIIWKMVTGREPTILDHINRDGNDNRWSNLRQCTWSQSNANRRSIDRGSALRGVVFHKGAWQAGIKVHGHLTHLGCFRTEEAAHAAYVAAGKKAFGEFFHDG